MNESKIICPKCGSPNLHSGKKGYSLKKGGIGWAIAGGVGLLGGLIGSNEIIITCLFCGHKFNPGEEQVSLNKNQYSYSNEEMSKEVEKIKENQKYQEINSKIKNKGIKRKKVICSECKSINETHFKFCRVCGTKIDISKMGMVNNGQNFEYTKCYECHQLTPIPSNKCKYCINCGEEIKI
ncbi:MAG: zinc ribbon domain-containing protein [Candidatus Symbiothrix sp.]|jgi:tellurium resistance protein TerD|nr:zinc ribbon domain-containing protein [Candidatus Symbiothrix sp.]